MQTIHVLSFKDTVEEPIPDYVIDNSGASQEELDNVGDNIVRIKGRDCPECSTPMELVDDPYIENCKTLWCPQCKEV